MKRTDFLKQIKRETREYEIVKFRYFLRMKMSFGKKRENRAFAYGIFERDYSFDNEKTQLPDPFYFKPRDIILYDLIPKEDLPRTKKGLIRLYKKCYSHKFLMGGSGEQDIDNLINGLDQTLHSGNSWYNTGLFDFAYKDEMEKYIYYFEIQFRNFSSSYAAVEMRVALANRFVTELSSFIKQPYEKTGMCVHKLWGQNHKRSGAKVSYGVSSGVSSDFVKSQLIYEQLQYVKNLFLKEIVKYIPIMQYSGYKSLCGINVFETNLTPYDKLDHSVYTSLGMNDMHGFNFSMAERLYMSTETIKERNGHNTDMMFVYNPERVTDFEMYGTAHGKTVEYLTREYMDNLYRVVLLKSIGLRYLHSIGMYRNQINKCKANKSSQKHLLKMKYLLNRDFYDFKKIDEELPVKEELARANQYLERNQYTKNSKYWHRYTYKSFTGTPDCIWRQIKSNYIEVENDLCRKLEVSSALTNYSTEASNRRLAIIQVILAIMTFVLLIFPGKAIELAEIIKVVWKSIIGLLAGLPDF